MAWYGPHLGIPVTRGYPLPATAVIQKFLYQCPRIAAPAPHSGTTHVASPVAVLTKQAALAVKARSGNGGKQLGACGGCHMAAIQQLP